jgi:nicotinate-nucleotide adenylyltransferase
VKLGILGGTFNPIHNGHLAMAEAARAAHGLDLVLFVPAGQPPHKEGGDIAPGQDRLRMVVLATAGREGLGVSDVELLRAGRSYTVETLEELRRRYPEAELFFILGEDSLRELPAWREPLRILQLARVVAVHRPGAKATFRPEDYPGLPGEAVRRLERDFVRMPPSPLESRAIRKAVREGRAIEGMVPPAVAQYIARRGLYRNV